MPGRVNQDLIADARAVRQEIQRLVPAASGPAGLRRIDAASATATKPAAKPVDLRAAAVLGVAMMAVAGGLIAAGLLSSDTAQTVLVVAGAAVALLLVLLLFAALKRALSITDDELKTALAAAGDIIDRLLKAAKGGDEDAAGDPDQPDPAPPAGGQELTA